MTLGYDKPLYILPFDHRASYIKGMFQLKEPLTAEEFDKVVDSKRLIYEGFLHAVKDGVPKAAAGILVDEKFGTDILDDATTHGYLTAVSTEKSGSDEFDFEYGADGFAQHLEKVKPTFAKALVRYNPEGDAALNLRQTARLKQLSDYCIEKNLPFMFELLVPATDAQLAKVNGDKDIYDLSVRPELMRTAMKTLQNDGVEPAIWKIEGVDKREDAESIVAVARRDGREDVGCIVLGRGADDEKVGDWLKIAASVPGFIGFAVGRTSFWDAVAGYEAKKFDRAAAVADISKRYRQWVDTFEAGRA